MSDTATDTTATTPTPAVIEKPKESDKVYDEAYVKQLRDEAAAARVAKRDAVDAAKAEVQAAHAAELAQKDVAYTELQQTLTDTTLELDKLKVAIAAKVPSEKVLQFAAILQGTDEESLTESAKSAHALFGTLDSRSPAIDPMRGLGGKPDDAMPLNGDPILNAMKGVLGIG